MVQTSATFPMPSAGKPTDRHASVSRTLHPRGALRLRTMLLHGLGAVAGIRSLALPSDPEEFAGWPHADVEQ